MQAPLGRAVIGGLVLSTFATLLIVPAFFALLMGRAQPVSPSVHPDDPASAHYDPAIPKDDEVSEALAPKAPGRSAGLQMPAKLTWLDDCPAPRLSTITVAGHATGTAAIENGS